MILAAWLIAHLCAAAGAGGEAPLPLDLPTALRLAGANAINVEIARSRLHAAEAEYQSALQQFFPWISVGAGFRHYDGDIQDVGGDILNTRKTAYTAGGRLVASVELGAAWYRRLAAKQAQRAAEHAVEAERQHSVELSASGWFDLARAEAQVELIGVAIRLVEEHARQLAGAVEVGYADEADPLRVEVRADGLRADMRTAEENKSIASARLAVVLRIDPRHTLTAGAALAPVKLGLEVLDADDLVDRALAQRAEIKRASAQTAAAAQSYDGARYGPLVPSLEAQTSWGGIGGGRDGRNGGFGYASDYVVGLSWRIGPGGIFDRARLASEQARFDEHTLLEARMRDVVASEVVTALARARFQAERVTLAERSVGLAERVVQLGRDRREFGVAAVLEFLQGEEELTAARARLLDAIAEYNKAQYQLAAAVGDIE